MQTLYMIIGREALRLYEKKGTDYQRHYIAANPEFSYQPNRVKDAVEALIKILIEEYNLENKSELAISVVGGDDPAVTETVYSALEGCVSNRYDLRSVLSKIIKRAGTEDKLMIKEYGVNFEGFNYRPANGAIQKGDYSLLGYTLQADDFMRYIE